MGKAVKINITLPEEELKRVDALCSKAGEYQERAYPASAPLFHETEGKRGGREEKTGRDDEGNGLEIKQLKEKAGQWDGVSEIRKRRDSK
jgi:hypothetical protein